MTPYEFVQQVYYAQEKVVLDFHPDDDKYKEVLLEGNLVIQELQKEEDWTWLRQRLVLGPVDHLPDHNVHDIPEFELPDWVYHPAMQYDDGLELHLVDHHGHINEWHYITIPWVSAGSIHKRHQGDMSHAGDINYTMKPLGAVFFGNTVTFNRPLTFGERHHKIAVTDVIKRMPLLHVCDSNCPRDDNGNCKLIEKRIFADIPDPSYMVLRTAALHAAGSPPAAPRAMDLADQAQKLLSSMRANDAAATAPDTLHHNTPGWISVI